MKKRNLVIFVLLCVLMFCAASVNAYQQQTNTDDLPKKLSGSYTAEALPEYMDDIWVPYQDIRRLVYTDTRTGKQGIADEHGNNLIPATCPYIIDNRNHGTLQNTQGHYYDILCVNDPVDWGIGYKCISLEDNKIYNENCTGFGGRGYSYTIEYHDGMAIVQDSIETNNPKYGYLDRAGNLAINFKFNLATNFEGGYAVIRRDNQWNIIEKDGSYVFSFSAWKSIAHVHDRVFVGKTRSGKWYRFELPVSSKQPKIAVDKSRVQILQRMHGDRYVVILNGNSRTQGSQSSGNLMPSRLKPGDHAEVAINSGVKIRREPAGAETGIQAFAGKDILILSGPVVEDGVNWYEVDFLGHRGWCMEGKNGTYYLRKTNGNPSSLKDNTKTHLKIGDKVEVVNTTSLTMYQKPNWAPIDILAFPGKEATVTDGPQIDNGTIWWEINFLGYKGWVIEVTGNGYRTLEKVK